MLYIFDWDGTLIDSTGKIVESMNRAIDHLGFLSKPEQSIRDIIGLGLPEAIALLMPELTCDEAEALRLEYSRQFVALDRAQPCALFPNVMDTLEQLKIDGHMLAVATGKSRRGLERVTAELGMSTFFHTTRCADETSSKPDPQMLFEILEELSVPPGEAIMIGDSEYDMAMAKNASMSRVGVTYGVHSEEKLLKYQPLSCIGCLSQLLENQERYVP